MIEASFKSSALKQFKKNIAKCISLTVMIFASFLIMPMIYFLCKMLLNKILVDKLFLGGSTNAIISMFIAIVFYFTIFAPMLLNIKKWFLLMSVGRPTIYRAFSFFKHPKMLAKSIWYCVTKSAIIIGVFAILFLPQLTFSLNLKNYINLSSTNTNSVLKVIYIITFIYFIFAAIFFMYFLILIFFTDYIYFYNKNISALKAIKISIQVSKIEYKQIIAVVLNMFPFVLSCFLIFPAIFAVPYIKTYCARFALEQLRYYNLMNL